MFLSRGGGEWAGGNRDDASENRSVLLDAPRTIAPYPKDEATWQALVACVRSTLAPFPQLTIVETDPGDAAHTEVVFTTTYWDGPAGTSSVIPDACAHHHEVAFVFGDALATRAKACHVALRAYAQMIADLSMGDRCDDVANDQIDCVPDRAFLDATANCIDAFGQPTACRCGDATQNSFTAMTAALAGCN